MAKDDEWLKWVLIGLGGLFLGAVLFGNRQDQPRMSTVQRGEGSRGAQAWSYDPWEQGSFPPASPPPEMNLAEPRHSRYEVEGAIATQDLALLRHYMESGMVYDPIAMTLGHIPASIRPYLENARDQAKYGALADVIRTAQQHQALLPRVGVQIPGVTSGIVPLAKFPVRTATGYLGGLP